MDDRRVEPEKLRRHVDPGGLGFGTTEEVEPTSEPLGQGRAMEALTFGIEVRAPGYNIFVAGPPGSGRSTAVSDVVSRFAATQPPPPDSIYLHNFEHPDRPLATRVPAGTGRRLASDLDAFVAAARQQISHAFETERYAERRRQIASRVAERREGELEALARFARDRGFAVEPTPNGIVAAPVSLGRPLTAADVERLPEDQRKDLERRGGEVQEEIGSTLARLVLVERSATEEVAALDREIALLAIEPLLHGLAEKYADLPPVVAHLERIREDVPNHLPDFRDGEPRPPGLEAVLHEDHTGRYRANVIVDNGGLSGAPVVVERNPSYYNLAGRIQYRGLFGTMVTDFHQIKAGALHRANGGFLVLRVEDVLRNPFAWEALTRALSTRCVQVENLGEHLSAVPTATLSPEPIPLDVKVVLIGSAVVRQLLYELDENFRKLFKGMVEFAPDVDWRAASISSYAAFVSRQVREGGLRHLDAEAVAEVIEDAARSAESQRKLSTSAAELTDLVTEAGHWAGKAGEPVVRREHVVKALAEREKRSGLTRERIQEMMLTGQIRVETGGVRVGELIGLSILSVGDRTFGVPSRVSATVAIGAGSLESIEREAKLSGPIHSKGFLIISGYLAERYAQRWPLSLRATITFEQSYGEVEGDSASSTELYALLSALSGCPLRQGVAVTGSVDQHGNVQAVGGAAKKVEGFFRLCEARGLTGDQGVIIPAANVDDLMLSADVIEAVRAGRFAVWAVANVDEGVEVLTGRPAGERDASGRFPDGSVHRLVEKRLEEYAELHRTFAIPADGQASGRRDQAAATS